MTGFLIRCFVTALGLWVASALLPGVHSTGFLAIVGAGLLLGVINAVVRPIVVVLTLPITIVTLGLFLLVVNALMVLLVGRMMHGFAVDNLGWAMLTAIIVTVVGWSANAFVGPRGRFELFVGGRRPM
jgi:putative membrane protein